MWIFQKNLLLKNEMREWVLRYFNDILLNFLQMITFLALRDLLR